MNITKTRGTRDIINFDNYIKIFEIIRKHLQFNNFQEIHTPYLEFEELFIKNLGENTDIVNKEMYYVSHIHQNNDEQKIVLRPELTASIMRAYFEENIQESPWQVFQIGSAFRHERPQKGRYREFFQCSIECINAKSLGYDLEILFILNNLFKKLINDSFQLQINYIGTLDERLLYKKELYNYCIKNKHLFPEYIQNKLQLDSILRILDSKEETVQKALINAPKISQFWSENNKKEWDNITKDLNKLNINFIHNERLIRGLDYYNGLIFEFVSNNLGAQNTFCGGGRYDELSQNLNPKSQVPSLGAGIGIDRLLLIIEENKNNIIANKRDSHIAIINDSLNESSIFYRISIKQDLEKERIKTKIYFDKESLKSGLKKANNENAYISIIITNTQILNNTIIFKEMQNEKKQIELPYNEAIKYIIQNYKENNNICAQ